MSSPLSVCLCKPDKHAWRETYYGWKCDSCGDFIPFGCEPWAYVSDDSPEPPEPDEDDLWTEDDESASIEADILDKARGE